MSKTQVDWTQLVLSFGIKEQLLLVLQNVTEVNRECSGLTEASSVYESTKHYGPITVIAPPRVFILYYGIGPRFVQKIEIPIGFFFWTNLGSIPVELIFNYILKLFSNLFNAPKQAYLGIQIYVGLMN